jgi:alkylation response protein AidB-like acyl-CoA dehydrogenase
MAKLAEFRATVQIQGTIMPRESATGRRMDAKRTPDSSVVSDPVARARALAPAISAAAARIEAARELPAELVIALHEARMFRMLLPRSLGGDEAPPPVYVQAIEELAKTDASTAWCVAQNSVCSTLAASFDREAAKTIFGDPRAVLAWGPPGSAAGARAVAEPGGYRVSGKWQFASGSRHATWLTAHCPVFEADGTRRVAANGTPVDISAVFPREQATIDDVWHVIGLKGTGSDSYSIEGLFVPQSFTASSFGRDPAGKRDKSPLYLFTVFQLFGASFAGIALGIARTTLDAFIELAKTKTPTGGKAVLRDNAVIQSQVGLAQAQLASSRVFLLHALDQIWEDACRTGALSVERRVQLRMASSHAIHQAKLVVDAAYHSAGATAIFESNPFERRFRDIHTLSQQVQGHFSVFEAIGQHFLGLPLHPRLI